MSFTHNGSLRKGIYGFSANPITKAHVHLIERASRLVDELWVVIFENKAKTITSSIHPMSLGLSLRERLHLVKESLRHLPNVHVDMSSRLLADYAYIRGITVNFRGLRNAEDLSYEQALCHGNRLQWAALETVFLLSEKTMQTVSSSQVRTLVREGAYLGDRVSLGVKQRLEERLCRQYLLGITGSIAVGKSVISREIMAHFKKKQIPCHAVDMDREVKRLFNMTHRGYFPEITMNIKNYFGHEVLHKKGVCQQKLAKTIFEDMDETTQAAHALNRLQDMLKQALWAIVRRRLRHKQGIILIEAAMIGEYAMTSLVNNNLLLITAGQDIQVERLQKRGPFSEDAAKKRIGYAGDSDTKRERLSQIIAKEGYGHLFIYENTQALDKQALELLSENIRIFFGLHVFKH